MKYLLLLIPLLSGCAITDDLEREISPQGTTWREMNPDYGIDKRTDAEKESDDRFEATQRAYQEEQDELYRKNNPSKVNAPKK